MREILFRGKTLLGKWIEGDLLNYLGCGKVHIAQNYKGAGGQEVIPETVGQYTGLTDKNGTKIFEGDIVKFGISKRIMYVHWNEETLTWELTDIGISTYEVNHLLNTVNLAEIQVESAYGEVFSEVIGNIHDNPELLEESEKE